MNRLRSPFTQTRRDAWVEIDLGNIEHNIKTIKSLINPQTKLLAVVKADSYGHGAPMIAPTLQASGVDMFGVASVDEGIQLRKAGLTAPILVLGSAPSWSFVSAIENDIQLSIFNEEHIHACEFAYNKLKLKPKVHIKVDTGMHRIGIPYHDAVEFIDKVKACDYIDLVGMFSHLACAEIASETQFQKNAWMNVYTQVKDTGLIYHFANTAGLISYKDLHFDMVRAGIGIYGLMPELPEGVSAELGLKQAMKLKGRIANIQTLPAGCGVSYGHTFVTQNESTRIATVPIGYADGVPRSLSNKIEGILYGQKVKQVGNITMDQMMFDISDVPEAEIGDVITLLGSEDGLNISIDNWAQILGTINYEMTCRLKVRLPRVYTR